MKKLVGFVAIVVLALFVWSCTTKTAETSKSVLTKSDLVGKRFNLKDATVNPSRPEEGGIPFISFEEEYATYLTGDILNNATYEVKEGKIVCTNTQMNSKRVYTIVDATTLKDEYEGIWVLSK